MFPSVQGDIWTNLANTYSNLYEATHDVEYLNSALAFGRKALGTTYGDVPSRSFALSNFSQLLVDNCRLRKRRRDCFEALELATNAILLPSKFQKEFHEWTLSYDDILGSSRSHGKVTREERSLCSIYSIFSP